MKSERTWLIALAVAVLLAVAAAFFVLRAVPEAAVPEVVELTPLQKEEAARTADSRCVVVERLVARGGDPLTAAVHLTKRNCAVKITQLTLEGAGPSGGHASISQRLDLPSSGEDVVELRDDEAHDDVAGWAWTVRIEFETSRSPKLEREFCGPNAVGACTGLTVITE